VEGARPRREPGGGGSDRRRHQGGEPEPCSPGSLSGAFPHQAREARAESLSALDGFVDRLGCARIGETYNQYAESPLLRERLSAYLEARRSAEVVLVGEAAGYRGARISGIPFTSERQLTGTGPAEATATIVHRVLTKLGLEDEVLLWNVVPTHPGGATSNRRPTRTEVEAASPFLRELTCGRVAIAVGRLAAAATEAPYVRHPSHGGAAAFEESLQRAFATIRRRRAPVRPFS
jgi:uracil-DNA glycosylase family 4